MGDEATRAADLMALVEAGALQVVRLDATALGGFSAVLPLTQTLAHHKRRVSFHDFPEIHQHAALASTVVDHIEMFPRDRPFDVRHRLTQRSAHERVARLAARMVEVLDERLKGKVIEHEPAAPQD